MPAHRLESPQARGGVGHGRIEALGLQGGPTWSPDASTLGADPTGLFAGFVAGLGDQVDLGVRFLVSGPLVLRAKYQLAGPSEAEALARPTTSFWGDGFARSFSLSTQLGAGFGLGANDSRALVGDLALLAGYRLANLYQPYVGLRAEAYSLGAASTRGEAASATIPQAGWLLGTQIDAADLFFRLELSGTWTWLGRLTEFGVSPGALAGARF